MNKDVIYIDVEDDITAIIGKIKASKEKIVALVPPKRSGALQSAVNLRLLDRMATTADKRLVLITNNQALIALSAAAAIPVAKNLQSKPELAEIAAIAVDDGDDIIDGAQLPVGDLEKTADVVTVSDSTSADEIASIDIDDATIATGAAKKSTKNKKKDKVPNFNSFRKKLFIGIGAGILLIAFIVWATVFAPRATIVITARTTPASVNTTVSLAGTAATDVTKGTIHSEVQTLKKDSSVEFDATGTKDIGTLAAGSMHIVRTSVSNSSLEVPAGTAFTSGNFVFHSTQSVTLQATQVGGSGLIQDEADVLVQAAGPGTGYNLSARAYTSDVSGISASGSAMSGGTSKVATVVTDEDVATATAKLTQQSTDDAKKAVSAKFTNGEIIIDESFTIEAAAPVSVPAVGAEATGKAKLTASTTYTITAIPRSDVEAYLDNELNKQLEGTTNQRVYNNGIDTVTLNSFVKAEPSTVKIIATGQIGPDINEDQIKEESAGKIYGEVQSSLESIDGIVSVDVKFSPFWVRKVPSNPEKITVEFKLENE